MLLANTNCNSYTCTTLKHYGTCNDFSENSERGIRVFASCMIFIFRKAVKQSMTSLQNDINIMSNGAAGGFSWWPSWIWLKTVKNQVYANILGTKPISCLRRKIFYESSFFCFWCFLASPESMARKLVTYDVINRPNSFQQSTNPAKVCLRNKGSGIKSLWIPVIFFFFWYFLIKRHFFLRIIIVFFLVLISFSIKTPYGQVFLKLSYICECDCESKVSRFLSSYTLLCLTLR